MLHTARKLPNTRQIPKTDLYFYGWPAAWLTLAEQADKNSLVYKTPEPFQSQQQSGAEVSKKQA